MKEFNFISWVQNQLNPTDEIIIPSGDDTAVFRTKADSIALTTDMLVDKTHFLLNKQSPTLIGKKSINVNVSDVAAMGMIPTYAVVSFAVPKAMPITTLKKISTGMLTACDTFGVQLIGGDFTRTTGPLVINVAMLGKRFNNFPPVTRSGARIGDQLFVTGALGGSLLGKHLRFTPRLTEMQAIRIITPIHAMIDISDGLSSEIHHIAKASQVGAQIIGKAIPISPAAKKYAGTNALHHAINDGENFELLLCTSKQGAKKLQQHYTHKTKLHHIGEITHKKHQVQLIDTTGNAHPLDALGYEH